MKRIVTGFVSAAFCAAPSFAQSDDAYLPPITSEADADPVSIDPATIPVIEITGTIPQIEPDARMAEGASEAPIDPPVEPALLPEHLRAQMTTFCLAIEQGCNAAPGGDAERAAAFTSGMDAVIDAIRNYPQTLRCEADRAPGERCEWN